MDYIESPTDWQKNSEQPSVFLAGGITGCPDWQKQMAEMLSRTNYAILNPRRADFPMGNPKAAEVQIRWEFEHLRKVDLLSFWFCKETIQPIVLFELGSWARGKTPAVVIGVEPGYPREQDVRIQMGLLGRTHIVSTLEGLADEIIRWESSVRRRCVSRTYFNEFEK